MANVSDNFNRANSVLGGNWTQLVASQGQFVLIVSNEIGSDTPGSYSAAAWNAKAFAANQFSRAIITNDAESFGLVLRANIAADRQFYQCYTAFGEIYIARQTGALRADLVNVTVAWDIGDEILFEVESTTLRVRKNGSVVLSTTDATYATGAPGVYFGFGVTARMDDWVGGPIAGGLREPATRRMSGMTGGLSGGMQGRRTLVRAGTTDFTLYVRLRLAEDGADATGLTITDIDLEYERTRAAAVGSDANALGAANSAHNDWGMFEVSAGLYRIDVPDAAFAGGVPEVVVTARHASILADSRTFQIVAFDPADAVRLGLTALPNAAADAAGGLPISDAGGLDLDAQVGTKINDLVNDTGTAGVVLADNAITSAKIQDGAITAAKLGSNSITASALASDAVTEIQSGLATAAALATVDGIVDDIKAKTDSLPSDPADQSLVIAATDAVMARLGTPAGSSMSADIATVQSDTNDIQSRLPTTLSSGGRMRSDMLAINEDGAAAANLAKTTRAIARGTVGAAASTTSVPTSAFAPSGAAVDQFKGRIVTFDADTATAALRGQCTDVVANSNSPTPTLTVTALTTAPAAGDTFSLT